MPGIIDSHVSLGPSLHVVERGVLLGDGSEEVWDISLKIGAEELTNPHPFGDMLMSFFYMLLCGWQ
jgi:hypothetical protein